jgi:EAL and modified HD-GYP domain-containing signal transduction protein
MPTHDSKVLQDVFVGRQPIYGRDLRLYAYELLYRGGDVDYADFPEGDRATSRVLLNTFTEFGLDRVVGGHLAFVNLTRGFIIGEYPLPLPRDRVVLEVLESVLLDTEVLEGLERLKRSGFRLALDDFVYRDDLVPLLEMADIVKIDVLGLEPAQIAENVDLFRSFGVELLAEKVETRRQFDTCVEAGFDLFQGYFLAKPNVVQGSSIPASRMNLMRLLAELHDPDCDFDRIQTIVGQDVSLSYKLLRHINTAAYGLPRRIDSIRETVTYLGVGTVRNLASLFLLSNAGDTPHELIVTSLQRARMCECLARIAGEGDPQPFFTVGLLSALDALVGLPMPTVLSKLPLAPELQAAILDGEGHLGEALRCTIAYERGEWGGVSCFGLSRGAIKSAFLDTVEWVESVDAELRGAA